VQAVDVNVLVYAHRAEAEQHERFRKWLEALVNGDSARSPCPLCA
jgi:predicted nucleic acid-binding protein